MLTGALNRFDKHRMAIKAVHIALSDHQKNTSIECIEKMVERTVDKVVYVTMKQFASYVGKYGELAPNSGDHWEVEKIKAWSYSINCANDPVVLTVSVGLRGYMYNIIT